MLGLFGTLSLATRSLSTQRQGTEIAGHNLANVNNPAYARQRLTIQTAATIPDAVGPQGTGSDATDIRGLRDLLLDRQITSETSVKGSLTAQQKALEYAQADLGQSIDRQTSGAEGAAASGGVGGQHGLAEEMSSLFNSFQSLSTNPTSTAERQVLLLKAQSVATQFNEVSSRLDSAHQLLDDTVRTDVDQANQYLDEIARLNNQIVSVEIGDGDKANDLRDTRQQRIEQLAALVDIQTQEQSTGGVDITIGGVSIISGSNMVDRLEAFDNPAGDTLVRAATAGTTLTLTGGSIQGTIEARDGALSTLQGDIDTLASQLISEVNAVHTGGYGLQGTTGASFFTGTNAATIQVNSALTADPSKIQASAVAGASGDNQIMVQLAQLAQKKVPALGNETFSQSYGRTVANLGQSLSSINGQIDNQTTVQEMLTRQRDSVSGVSLDEEMTDLIRYQKAFEASARLVSMVDEMLDTVLNMKR